MIDLAIDTTIIEKLSALERALREDKGALSLFGLFRRQGSLGLWDLLVSAHWLGEDQPENRAHIFRRLREWLSDEEMLQLSRVVILYPSDPFYQALDGIRVREAGMEVSGRLSVRDRLTVRPGRMELRDCVVNGIAFEHAILFTYEPGATEREGFHERD